MRLRPLVVVLLLASLAHAQTHKKPHSKATAAQVARGRYLLTAVSPCLYCHSDVDWKSIPPHIVPGHAGSGGPFADQTVPFPVYVPNISSDAETGVGGWTDAQLGRAIREGIGPDGRVLSPIMPYMHFRVMSDDDLAAVIAYLRTLPPVHKPTHTPTIPDEVRKQLPPPPPLAKPVHAPDMKDPVKRGQYLAALADCGGCHTPLDEKGQPRLDLAYAGGAPRKGPWGEVVSANITPDPSGISYYDQKLFLQVIRTGHVKARTLSKIMLTSLYRHMTDQDLKAIYAYLRTLKPVKHRVDNTEPPTYCKICRHKHGGGDLN
jgi:mono/diheme cytochrome c family protein